MPEPEPDSDGYPRSDDSSLVRAFRKWAEVWAAYSDTSDTSETSDDSEAAEVLQRGIVCNGSVLRVAGGFLTMGSSDRYELRHVELVGATSVGIVLFFNFPSLYLVTLDIGAVHHPDLGGALLEAGCVGWLDLDHYHVEVAQLNTAHDGSTWWTHLDALMSTSDTSDTSDTNDSDERLAH